MSAHAQKTIRKSTTAIRKTLISLSSTYRQTVRVTAQASHSQMPHQKALVCVQRVIYEIYQKNRLVETFIDIQKQ